MRLERSTPWRPGTARPGRLALLAGAVLACLLGQVAARGQGPPSLDPGKALTQLGLDTWTTDHGLPSATVTAVLSTREGYVWLGTYDGLARFDGSRFTVFTQADGLGNNGIRALCEDRDGSLWVGTNGGGVARLARGRFRRFTAVDGLPSEIVWSLHADVRDGSVWVGTNGGGLARYRDGRIERFDPRDSGRTVAAMAQEADGTLWLAAQADGLRRRAPDGSFRTFSVGDGIPAGLVAGVGLGRDGAVRVATSNGICVLRNGRVEPLPGEMAPLRTGLFSSVLEDAAGTLWIGTNGSGLARYAGGKVSYIGSRDGVGDAVYALHADRDGGLWIGTNGAGVSRLRDGSFTSYSSREGLSRDFAYTAFRDRSGTLWAGTSGGLDRLDGAGFVAASPPFGRVVAVRSIAEGPDGALWVGSYGAGVWRLLSGRWQGWTAKDGLAHDTVRAVLVDRTGRVWAATNGGLSVRDGEAWRSYGIADGLPSSSLIGLAEDAAGAVWIGTDGAGLVRFDRGRFETFTSREGLASDVVLALRADSEGSLWVATNGGLSRFSGGRLATFTNAAGLPASAVTQVVEDARGDVWVGTSRGVLRIARPSLSPGRSLEVETFDHLDGMKSSQCTAPGQPSAFRDHDGTLWFATTRGLARVDPARPRGFARAPSVVVEEVAVDGRPAGFHDGVDAPAGTSRIEFRFAKLSPRAPQKTAVRFLLEGFDDGWVDARDRTRADYTHVPPGTYRFRVAARAGSSAWNESAEAIPIRIRPRFHQTRLFALASTAGVLALLAAGYRLRVRTLAARGRELARLVEERTRDLAEQKARAEEAHAEATRLLAERERVTSELRRQGEYLASLHETALAVMDRLEPQQLLQTLVERATGLLDAADGFLYLESADGSLLERRVWSGNRPRDEFVERGRGAVGRAWELGAAVTVDDYDAWPERIPEVPAGVFGALMAVPLHFGGAVRGVLGVVHGRGARRFTDVEGRLLESFARLASLALENARLFRALQEELAERARAQHGLAESELRFRQLAENVDALFFVGTIDPPVFLYVSPGFERIWGRPSTLRWAEVLDTVHPDDREVVLDSVRRQEQGYDLEFRIFRPDGALRWVHARVFPVPDEEGRVARVAGIVEDVTARKSVEQMREDLVRTLVHDLRNPLTSMLASMEVLEAALTGPESRAKVEIVRIARRGGLKLRSLVDAILDVARLEQGKMPLDLAPLRLREAVDEALELQAPLADPRGLRLRNEVAQDLPRVVADRELLARILQNLVGNAVKFSPDGGAIRVGAEVSGAWVSVSVVDDGPGLPLKLRERVFERFVTGRHAASGSGLGLAFCKLAVEAQGGRIRAESALGGGARFVFTLPREGEPGASASRSAGS